MQKKDSLGSLLVRDAGVPVRRVEEALQRQVIYGGSLGTNLLELEAIDEAELNRCLSQASGLPCAEPAWIDQADERAQHVFPRKLVDRYRILPIRLAQAQLTVVVAEAVDQAVLDELAHLLEVKITPYVVSELRFHYGLERHFSVAMPSRFVSLMRRLDAGLGRGHEAASPERQPRLSLEDLEAGWADESADSIETATTSPPTNDPVSSPDTQEPFAATDAVGPASVTVDAVVPEPRSRGTVTEPGLVGAAAAQPAPAEAPPGDSKSASTGDLQRRSVLSLSEATESMARALNRDGIVDASLGFLRGQLRSSWVFAIRGDHAELWGSERADGHFVTDPLRVALEPGSLLTTVARSATHYVGPCPRNAGTISLYRTLGQSPPETVVAFPVLLKNRSVLVFLGHCTPPGQEATRLPELLELGRAASEACTRLILRRKTMTSPRPVSGLSAKADDPQAGESDSLPSDTLNTQMSSDSGPFTMPFAPPFEDELVPTLSDSLGDLLYDTDSVAALRAAEALLQEDTLDQLGEVLRRIHSDLIRDSDQMDQAAAGAAMLRDLESVPLLIDLLESPAPGHIEAALRALRVLTRADWDVNTRRWHSWWEEAQRRPREDWLVEALTRDDRELRAGAAAELHRLTAARIPFDPDGPKKEWKRAQAEWRIWLKHEY